MGIVWMRGLTLECQEREKEKPEYPGATGGDGTAAEAKFFRRKRAGTTGQGG